MRGKPISAAVAVRTEKWGLGLGPCPLAREWQRWRSCSALWGRSGALPGTRSSVCEMAGRGRGFETRAGPVRERQRRGPGVEEGGDGAPARLVRDQTDAEESPVEACVVETASRAAKPSALGRPSSVWRRTPGSPSGSSRGAFAPLSLSPRCTAHPLATFESALLRSMSAPLPSIVMSEAVIGAWKS